MRRLLIMTAIVFAWLDNVDRVPGQETLPENVQKVAEDQVRSTIATERQIAASNTASVNCWACHQGKIELIYTPEIHKLHQGLLVAQMSPLADEIQNRWLLTYSVHNPLGIEVGAVDQALRNQLKLEENQGLVVLSVLDDSEGAKIGLASFDVLISLDQFPISSGDQLQAALKQLAEKEVTVLLMREGKLVKLNAKMPRFETMDYAIAGEAEVAWASLQGIYRIGVTLKELEPPLRLHLSLETGGLLISEVVAESPAASAGLQANDVLLRCNGQLIKTVEQINQTIQEVKSNPIKLNLIRAGKPLELDVTPRQEFADAWALEWKELDFSKGLATIALEPMMLPHIRREDPNLNQIDLGRRINGELPDLQSEPLQTELDAIQMALDKLKAKVKQVEVVKTFDQTDSALEGARDQTIEDALTSDRVLKQHDTLRGEINALLNQIRTSDPEQAKQVEAIRQQILESWSEVEKLAKPKESQ